MLIEFDLDERNLFDLEEGFVKGNMFPEIYDEYKNYKPKKPNIKSERENLLYKIMILDFAINDINLFLAINPNNEKYIKQLSDYNKNLDMLKKEYENKYGVFSYYNEKSNKYSYINNPWPWEDYNV